ncbi:MAG: hypothetical protein LBK98_02850 [Peptococcaceae bacterium]|nr:hypothetical protein [Peptococcaceae bacterium]
MRRTAAGPRRRAVYDHVPIFLVSVSIAYAPVSTGIGNFAGEHWRFSALSPFVAANIAGLIVITITLPLLLRILRRLWEIVAPFGKEPR